ncbi:hypothetical protein Goshw_000424 [Gossypium schwendimanii]|uniref:Uncharacterized protein n=1 Tax=Gossypium schwendimanii TaxID=34291 RepID=A0A7J9KIW6_GOSSC|nr:hypothetical protein [Gossypium schwendimanii]
MLGKFVNFHFHFNLSCISNDLMEATYSSVDVLK